MLNKIVLWCQKQNHRLWCQIGLKQCTGATSSDFVWADLSVRSPWILFVVGIKTVMCRIKLSKECMIYIISISYLYHINLISISYLYHIYIRSISYLYLYHIYIISISKIKSMAVRSYLAAIASFCEEKSRTRLVYIEWCLDNSSLLTCSHFVLFHITRYNGQVAPKTI